MTETKTCRRCWYALPVAQFPADPRNRDGLRSYCRACERLYDREYRHRRFGAAPKKHREVAG